MTVVHVQERFVGDLPHPRHLREYENIMPGAADRMLSLAERGLDHNMAMERLLVTQQISDMQWGLWLGFAAFFGLLACAAYTAASGNNVATVAFLGASALNTVGLFLNTRHAPD